MVCIDVDEDDWIYVTKQKDACAWPEPVLFDNIEEAFKYSDAWRLPGKEQNVQVVAYNDT